MYCPSATGARVLSSRTIQVYGNDATIFGFPDDDYFRDAHIHAANNRIFNETAADLPQHAVVLDGGANIGLMTLTAARAAPAIGYILAVEPSPTARTCLHRNLAANHIDEHVTVVPAALADRVGAVRLNECTTLAHSHIGRTGTPVTASTIDRVVKRADVKRLDLIKLDIEGYEFDALRGATKTIDRFAPTFIVEFSSFAICARRRESPVLFLEYLLATFKEFTYRQPDGIERCVKSTGQLLDFLYQNMSWSIVNDIRCRTPKCSSRRGYSRLSGRLAALLFR